MNTTYQTLIVKFSEPITALDGIFDDTGDGGNGLFIGKYIGAARGRGWSSHGGDHCGSGCIQSPLIEW